MQNRGALWIFTILLALACLWQLSFSIFTGRVESNAATVAQEKVDSVLTVAGNEGLKADSLKLIYENRYLRDQRNEKVYPVFGYTYQECKEKEINLGLDLKGGMAVTLEVSIPELVSNLADNSQDATFQQALANARERMTSSDAGFITLFGEEFAKLDPNAKLAAVFHSPDNKDMFPREATNEEILDALRRESQTAVENTEKILRTRIDKFGVAQPSIQKQLNGRIQIELPGVKDKERVRDVLQSTANLEFWETYENVEVYPLLEQANTQLSAKLYPELEAVDTTKLSAAEKLAASGADATTDFSFTLSTGSAITGATEGVEKKLLDFLQSSAAVDKETWFDFDRVTFQSGSAKLDTEKSEAQLANLKEILVAFPDVELKIGGYTDSTGNEEANKKLSQARADAVVAALVAKGVESTRLTAEGYGSQFPVASNATAEGRAKNRRMALRVTAKGDSTDGDLAELLRSDEDSAGSPLDTAKAQEDFNKRNPLFAKMRPAVYQVQNGGFNLSKGPAVGNAVIADTMEVNRMLRMPAVQKTLPPDCKLLWGSKPFEGTDVLTLYAIKVPRGGKAKLDGSTIVDANQDFDMKGDVEVSMQMNAEGAATWKVMTGDNVGKAIAIVLDDLVYSAPIVQNEIGGGRSSISMGSGDLNQQIEEAKDLANLLKAGALPAPARIIDETVVGPSLGRDNVNDGLMSFAVALLLVMIYMVLYYARAGWVADLALLVNLFVLLGSLASLQASLTLPGIAGIVLTMGMAVDANVLIYERIREELRAGKMLKSAVDLGYKGALSAIIDSNVTTLITAIILLVFGSGPVRGFATTLGIGILTSLFTAIFLSRMVITWRLEHGKSMSFWSGWSKDVFANANFDFMGKRKYMYIFSSIVIAIGLFSMVTRGFNWGVDFSGGRTYVVKFQEDVRVDDVRSSLEGAFVSGDGIPSSLNVKTYGDAKQLKITTNYLVNSREAEADAQVDAKLASGLEGKGAYEVIESRKVDATISDDIQTSAIYSVTLALIMIFVYVAVRFRRWQFGLGGILAIMHDTLFVLGIYSVFYSIVPFSMEIDEAFIAAILTVVGYSINDTVVVFDRIREYMRDHKRDETVVVFNKAINATLSRTMNTSLTTLLVLLIIFFFGGVSIKGFVFALLAGIFIGTYSSVFIASAFVVDLLKGRRDKNI